MMLLKPLTSYYVIIGRRTVAEKSKKFKTSVNFTLQKRSATVFASEASLKANRLLCLKNGLFLHSKSFLWTVRHDDTIPSTLLKSYDVVEASHKLLCHHRT